MKRYLSTFLAALVVLSTANTACAQLAPDATVKTAVEGTVNAMKADPAARGGDLAKTTQIVATHFVPYTDFERTTRIAAGDAWQNATPEQRKQLFEQFQTLLVRMYAASLAQLREQNATFKFSASKAAANARDTVVQSHVLTHGGDDAVGYRLVKTSSGWKIYDINMMGAWLIQIYQKQFADQLAKGGIDGLIQFLTQHNARSTQ